MRNSIIGIFALTAITLVIGVSLCGCQSPQDRYANELISREEFATLYNERANDVLPSAVKKCFPDAHFDIKVIDFKESFTDSGVVYDITINQNVAIGDADDVDWENAWRANRESSLDSFEEEEAVIASFNTDHRTVNVSSVFELSGTVFKAPKRLMFLDDDGNTYSIESWAITKNDGETYDSRWMNFASSKTGTSSSTKSAGSSRNTGSTKNTARQKCLSCNGAGFVKYYAGGEGSDYTYGTCTACNGTGYAE